jgi:hypothetical protein
LAPPTLRLPIASGIAHRQLIFTANKMGSAPPTQATDAVLVASEAIPDDAQQVQGIDWAALPDEQRLIISDFVHQLTGQGFQSSSIGDAIRIINDMVGSLWVAAAMKQF